VRVPQNAAFISPKLPRIGSRFLPLSETRSARACDLKAAPLFSPWAYRHGNHMENSFPTSVARLVKDMQGTRQAHDTNSAWPEV
jgi:hypothetical protein